MEPLLEAVVWRRHRNPQGHYVPWTQVASGQKEPTPFDRQGLELEGIPLEPDETWGLLGGPPLSM